MKDRVPKHADSTETCTHALINNCFVHFRIGLDVVVVFSFFFFLLRNRERIVGNGEINEYQMHTHAMKEKKTALNTMKATTSTTSEKKKKERKKTNEFENVSSKQ